MAKPRINQFTISIKGKRRVNEDRVLAKKINKIYPRPYQEKKNWVLVVVADGMGGYQRGDWASEILISKLTNILEVISTDDYYEVSLFIREQINHINDLIYRESQKLGNQMGCTVSGALVLGDKCLFFNVGDSRTYVVSPGKIERMTVDHSADEDAIRKGLIGEEDRGKSEYSHALTRSIGTDPEVEIDVFPQDRFYTLEEGEIIFACTDGLWNVVNDRDIREYISREGNNLKKSLSVLVKHAFISGSKDNISAAAIAYGKYPRHSGHRSGKDVVPYKVKRDWKRLPILALSLILASLSIFFAIKFYNNLPQQAEKMPVSDSHNEQAENNGYQNDGNSSSQETGNSSNYTESTLGINEQTNHDASVKDGTSSTTKESKKSPKDHSSHNNGKENSNNSEQGASENKSGGTKNKSEGGKNSQGNPGTDPTKSPQTGNQNSEDPNALSPKQKMQKLSEKTIEIIRKLKIPLMGNQEIFGNVNETIEFVVLKKQLFCKNDLGLLSNNNRFSTVNHKKNFDYLLEKTNVELGHFFNTFNSDGITFEIQLKKIKKFIGYAKFDVDNKNQKKSDNFHYLKKRQFSNSKAIEALMENYEMGNYDDSFKIALDVIQKVDVTLYDKLVAHEYLIEILAEFDDLTATKRLSSLIKKLPDLFQEALLSQDNKLILGWEGESCKNVTVGKYVKLFGGFKSIKTKNKELQCSAIEVLMTFELLNDSGSYLNVDFHLIKNVMGQTVINCKKENQWSKKMRNGKSYFLFSFDLNKEPKLISGNWNTEIKINIEESKVKKCNSGQSLNKDIAKKGKVLFNPISCKIIFYYEK